MSLKNAVRITTMCLGRICVGYRTSTPTTSGPDYIDVVSVFVSAFVIVWAALVVLLVVSTMPSNVDEVWMDSMVPIVFILRQG